MGQQQLLLIVLGVIIVGIAVVVGINLFNANAEEAAKDGVVSDCTNLGAMAQQFYKKPLSMGGGGKSFLGWSIPSQMITTINGNFMTASIQADEVSIIGTGSEVVTSGDSIRVETVVRADQMYTVIIN